jgi:hypothetical protein
MLVSDILRSCSHDHVARAAVVSIGGDFARRVNSFAAERGESVGDYTARHVRRFSQRASERDWRYVLATMEGEDLALLAGFQAVVLRMMADGEGSVEGVSKRADA